MINKALWLLGLLWFSSVTLSAEKPLLRLGVLSSGTLAWELAAMQQGNLLQDAPFNLQTVALSNQQAGKVALQAGSVDMIISDWIWVSSMREQGHDYTFYPYSASAGGLIVPANSPIKTLADLPGKKLGIAGGELDKNWALLQALGQKQGLALNATVEKVIAAPPLLNQQLASQRVDALLTYWQFAARLEAQGYRQLMSGEEMIRALGIDETLPSLGYVFKQSWGEAHKTALQTFFALTQTAKNALCQQDTAWQNIAALTETEDPATQTQLRQRYCQGRIVHWGAAEQAAAQKVFQWLQTLEDHKLSGQTPTLNAGTFWPAD